MGEARGDKAVGFNWIFVASRFVFAILLAGTFCFWWLARADLVGALRANATRAPQCVSGSGSGIAIVRCLWLWGQTINEPSEAILVGRARGAKWAKGV